MTINYRFKIMYAFGVIFIVASHCGNGGISLFYEWFPPYAFHLGLFVFVSGYFYKDQVENETKKYILKKAKSLILPLYLWNACYVLIIQLLSSKGFLMGSGDITFSRFFIDPITNGHQFVYTLGGWFVIPLFMTQVYNVLIRKLFSFFFNSITEWFWFLLNLVLGILGVYLASKGFNTGWWLVLVRMLYFFPFYSLGILYKKVIEKHDNISGILYFGTIFICQLIIIYYYGRSPSYIPSWCKNFIDGPVLPFIVGFLGIAFWLRVSRLLEPLIKNSKLIILITDNMYSIMINQLMGFMVVKTIFAFINKFTIFCNNFNWLSYKTDIFYIYLPREIDQIKIIYLITGITFPIMLQVVINKVKTYFIKKTN